MSRGGVKHRKRRDRQAAKAKLAALASPMIAEARARCLEEFEPLWRPAGWWPVKLPPDERHAAQERARAAAYAWLRETVGGDPATPGRDCEPFAECNDVALMRRAWLAMRRATLADIVRHAERAETERRGG